MPTLTAITYNTTGAPTTASTSGWSTITSGTSGWSTLTSGWSTITSGTSGWSTLTSVTSESTTWHGAPTYYETPLPEVDPETERRAACARDARESADQRALRTLCSLLTERQRDELHLERRITLRGSAGTLFRIGTTHCNGNVEWLDDEGVPRGRLCAHPHRVLFDGGVLPLYDVIIGQLLALTDDERAFVAGANLHWGRWPYPDPDRAAA